MTENCDKFQVETIGDGYLVVSGLPNRNGDTHAREIADMSLAFQRSVRTFKLAHLPDETVALRIGIHTGNIAETFPKKFAKLAPAIPFLLFFELNQCKYTILALF